MTLKASSQSPGFTTGGTAGICRQLLSSIRLIVTQECLDNQEFEELVS
jgi:hypothetical protein